MPMPLDKEAELKAKILHLIYQAELRWKIRVTDLRVVRASSTPPTITGIEFDTVDYPKKPGPSETKDDLPDTLLGHPIKYTDDIKLEGFEIKLGPFEFYGPEEDAINKT